MHGTGSKVRVGVDPATSARVELIEGIEVLLVVHRGDRLVLRRSRRTDRQPGPGSRRASLDALPDGRQALVPLGMACGRMSLHRRISQDQHARRIRAHRRRKRMTSRESSNSTYITALRMLGENGSPPGVTMTAKTTMPRITNRR